MAFGSAVRGRGLQGEGISTSAYSSKPCEVTWVLLSSPPGLVDSNWCVGAVLEKKLPPLPVTLALGAFLNHWRNRFHCGFSITVG